MNMKMAIVMMFLSLMNIQVKELGGVHVYDPIFGSVLKIGLVGAQALVSYTADSIRGLVGCLVAGPINRPIVGFTRQLVSKSGRVGQSGLVEKSALVRGNFLIFSKFRVKYVIKRLRG